MDLDTSLTGVVGAVIGVLSLCLAVALAIWLMRRVQIARPEGVRGGIHAVAFTSWVWSIRLFVFLAVLLMATILLSIVGFLLQGVP